ncbi:uncharacterized protein N7459_006017 [Penicillium hispanicum]|uniref:uncharacterized protein n=1 Tax=Penicillium hispanicum TaxID=1080232 RepID=UPI00253FB0B7|nr:uncharacterized protein N7459_006017 [Penicillium hispanicum]KAJ5580032.1 hypothetical protein N7459_006017 [Penicillium hispanicum]
MTCSPWSDRLLGPRVDPDCRSFDLTLQFEDVVLTCIPAGLFLCLSLAEIRSLSRKQIVQSGQLDGLLLSKLTVWMAILVAQLAYLILRITNEAFSTSASLATDTLSVVATGAAVPLSFFNHQRALRPSTLLSLYLSTCSLFGIARVHTAWLKAPYSLDAGVMTSLFVLTTTALLLESTCQRVKSNTTPNHKSREEYSGFWNRTAFVWLLDIFQTGYRKVIVLDDLPMLDRKLESRVSHFELLSTWGTSRNHQERHSLIRACFRAYTRPFLSTILPRLAVTGFTFMQPFLINTTLQFVDGRHRNENYGKGLIGAWALGYLGIAVSNSVYKYQNLRFVTKFRGGLDALIYERMLQIRAADGGDITAVTLMGTDVERIVSGLQLLNEVWGSTVDIAIACWLLERQLSLACLAPIALVLAADLDISSLVLTVGASKISAAASSAQRQWIERVQERLRVTSATLAGIKSVKMLGISPVVSSVISNLRQAEIKTSSIFRKILVATLCLCKSLTCVSCSPDLLIPSLAALGPINLAPAFTLAIYVIIAVYWKDATLLTAQAFTSIALISLLTTPVTVLIQTLPKVTQCIGSFDRIQTYCNTASRPTTETGEQTLKADPLNGPLIDLRPSTPINQSDSSQEPSNHGILLDGQSFAWGRTSLPVLKGLKLEIKQKAITAVMGPIGSGKSAFLMSLLGETIPIPSWTGQDLHRQLCTRKIAYCGQQPWLENKTVRGNIVGSLPFEWKWYETVKTACALDADLKQLKRGDKTKIGSQGLSLSGGQKQRIALARAIYSRPQLLLLDDVFSGIDANTLKAIAIQLLGDEGLLRKNEVTVVLATNSEEALHHADSVVILQNGEIIKTSESARLPQERDGLANLGSRLLHDGEPTPEIPQAHETNQPIRYTETDAEELPAGQSVDDLQRKKGDMRVYQFYLARSGYLLVALYVATVAIWVFCTEFSTIWVKWWAAANSERPNQSVGLYVGMYAMLGVVGTIGVCLAAWIAIVPMISNSSSEMHSDVLKTTLKAPFHFFTKTDSGEILNRFSEDMELIDMELPTTMVNYSSTVFMCFSKIIVIAIFSKYLGLAIPVLGILIYFLQHFYLQTSRQVRLLGIEAKAPLYSYFTESVAGAVTIRAFGWESQYQEQGYSVIDKSQQPFYMLSCIQYCLGFVLEVITAVLATGLVAMVVTLTKQFSAGGVGVSLVALVSFSETLVRLIQTWTELESSIGAVARVKQYSEDTESEDQAEQAAIPPLGWPLAGAVELVDLDASYGPNADSTIRNISLSIQPGQHVAVCGRSGSGKSSFLLSLMRMMDVRGGRILVDDIDVSVLTCDDYRSRINVIPQDPFLLHGTLRFNIDPFGVVSDERITSALQRVQLWPLVAAKGGLDMLVDSNAWSTGQVQLFCFARAMVKDCKLLLLDEAMSSVDTATQALMQDIIDSDFASCTVVSVMHRLEHIASYDQTAVFDKGSLVEFGKTGELLTGQSLLSKLYHSGGNR